MNITNYIGIDPGVNGAIAVITSENYYVVNPIKMLNNDTVDVERIISDIPFPNQNDYVIAYIEKVWKPNKLIRIAGIIEGIFKTLDIPIYLVAPSTWRKEILGNSHATKEDAIKYCLENYPNISLLRTERSRVPDHNFAEALCIVEYARRKHQNEK